MFSSTFFNAKSLFLKRGSFTAHALTLLTGTTIAQAITVISAPVLSRLYSPEDFGVMAVFISLSSMIGIIACGRYENAIMLPDKDEDAGNVLALSILISLAVSLLLVVGVALFGRQIATLLKNPALTPWLWLMPITVFMIGLYQACNFWSSRKKQFSRLAVSRVSNSMATLGTQVGAGLFTTGGPLGLIAGQVAGWTVSAGVLVSRIICHDLPFLFKNIKRNNIWRQALIYYRFPLIDIWAILANFGSQKLPILILNNFFDATIVGYYFFGYSVLNFPLLFINASISQVFFQRYEEKKQTGGKKEFTLKMIKYLALIAIFPAALLFLFAPTLFKVIFGQEWVVAGDYIRILAPILYFRFIASPISTVAWSERKNLWFLLWQLSLLSCSVLSFLMGGFLGEVYFALIFFSISCSVLYFISIIMTVKMASSLIY